MNKLKAFFKKKAVKIITLIILIIVVILTTLYLLFFRNKLNDKQIQEFSYVRTVTLSYGTLNETISASGTIESQNTSTISSSVNNATISKINYSVGDYVKQGDVIIELDTTNLNKQISKVSDSISEQEDRLQDSYDSAYDDYESKASSYNSAKSALASAKANYDAAYAIVKDYIKAYDDAENALNIHITTQMQADISIDVVKTEEAYKDLNNKLSAAKKELEAIKSSTNYDKLYSDYQKAQEAYDAAKSSLSQADSKLDDAYDALQDGVDTDSLDELNDTVADYKLKAKTDGQITSINAVLGSNTNGTLATIQDTSKLKISLTIDEYDILKLKLGMKAIIETDASDKTYEGEVSVISPVATSGMGSSGFEIEVNVTSEDVSDLLIGMNAEVTIIISSGDESFNVPIDAIETKADSTSVIYVEDNNGEFYEVEVTTGNSNGYYIEIYSNQLTEGMKVRASADVNQAEVNINSDEVNEDGFNPFAQMSGGPSGGGSFSGMPSGGPSGGGGMPGGF